MLTAHGFRSVGPPPPAGPAQMAVAIVVPPRKTRRIPAELGTYPVRESARCSCEDIYVQREM